MIWMLLTFLLGAAVAMAVWPLLAPARGVRHVKARRDFYTKRLSEIEAEETAELITAEEAAALRLEAQRRLLDTAETAQEDHTDMPQPRTYAAISIATLVVLGGVTLYTLKGSPTLPSANPSASVAMAEGGSGGAAGAQTAADVDAMIGQLVARLESNPGDVQGWRMLGWSYFHMERYADSVEAYRHAVALAPDNADFQASLGEAMVMAAGGLVTDEAKAAFAEAGKLNPDEPRARFFTGLALDQGGDIKGALDTWIELLNAAPPDAEWAPGLRQRITARAAEARIDITGRIENLPALPSLPSAEAAPGPTPEQVQDAAAMPAEDRAAMIEGMVARLKARLEDNPNDPDGWVRLIRSRTVLGDRAAAKAALVQAREALAGDPAARDKVTSEAAGLGVTLN